MKKLLTFAVAFMMCALGASAQLNVFNHLGLDVSASTTGIGVELSTPVTPWMQLRGGMSFVPKITFNTDVNGSVNTGALGYQDFTVNVEGNVARTQGNVILNVYPFGPLSGFFVAGGAYFGGEKLVGITGHSREVENLQQQGYDGYVEIGDYKLEFEKGGNVNGALITKKFRPYAGLGFGRPCPKSRLGFMIELGVQFTGKLKVAQGADLTPIDIATLSNDDDWQKIMDKLTVYPVLKLTLCGKLF